MCSDRTISEILEGIDTLYREGTRESIEAHFNDLLSEYEGEGDSRSSDYVTLLNELAGWYRGISRYEDSEKRFEQVLRIMEAEGLQDSVAYARTLLNLAGLYRLTGRFSESLETSLKAQALIDTDPEGDEYASATALNSITLTYLAAGDLPAAKASAIVTLDNARTSSVAGEHEIATALSNLANIHSQLGELEEAEKLLKEALALHERMAKENFHHGAVLAALGTVLFREERFEEAVAAFRESCASTERFFGRNIEYAIGQYNLARSLEAVGDTFAAIANVRGGLDLTIALLGRDHPRVDEYRSYLAALEAGSSQQGE